MSASMAPKDTSRAIVDALIRLRTSAHALAPQRSVQEEELTWMLGNHTATPRGEGRPAEHGGAGTAGRLDGS